MYEFERLKQKKFKVKHVTLEPETLLIANIRFIEYYKNYIKIVAYDYKSFEFYLLDIITFEATNYEEKGE